MSRTVPLTALLHTGPDAAHHLLAYSGGLDSSVLLHLASGAALPGLQAVHVHHGLQAVADDWAAHCQKQCEALGVTLRVERVQVSRNDPKGPEAAARAARYAALRKHLPEGGVLLTAHHQQDQAETLLLRLLRGTGVEGLAAMPTLGRFESGELWRPLLAVPRAQLLAYAQAQGLSWIEDAHNHDPRYTRSWVRQHLLPLMQSRQPQSVALLARTAVHAGEAAEILQQVASTDLDSCKGEQPNSLNIPALLALSPARRHSAMRYWFLQLNLPMPHAGMLARLQKEVLEAAASATPLLSWPGAEVRRYRRQLFANTPLPSLPEAWQAAWDGVNPLALPSACGSLQAEAPFADGALHVRFPQGGERIRPAKRAHHHGLKQLAQEAGIPPWQRCRLPMLFAGTRLVSIAGIWTVEGGPVLHWRTKD